MTKSYTLNIANLTTNDDATKIREHFSNIHGVQKIDIVMDLKLVTLYYGEEVGSPHKLLTAFGDLGYEVR